MELYTVVEKNDNAIKAVGGIYIEKKKYKKSELKSYLEIAKHYYVKVRSVSDSTDFNDRYHDEWTNYLPCNHLNMVIKEDKLYGFIAYGLARFEEDVVILTFEKNELTLCDGSCYSSIDRTFTLNKYEFNEEIYYKIKDGVEVDPNTGSATHYFMAFDVIVKDNKPVGLKTEKVLFDLLNPATFKQELVEEDVLGAQRYKNYYKYELVEV